MTTEIREILRCALCAAESEYTIIGSTNAVGYPDLDTRPPEMRRSTIFAWVQRCPSCGYCAAEIFKPCTTARTVVASSAYMQQLNNGAFPVLANSFLCKAMLDEARRDHAAATWAHIHAAWACDDVDNNAQASRCRKRAADLLTLTESRGLRLCNQRGLSGALLVDLLRRAGEQKKAKQALAAKLNANLGKSMIEILMFQAELLDKSDLASHTVAEL